MPAPGPELGQLGPEQLWMEVVVAEHTVGIVAAEDTVGIVAAEDIVGIVVAEQMALVDTAAAEDIESSLFGRLNRESLGTRKIFNFVFLNFSQFEPSTFSICNRQRKSRHDQQINHF